jgi:hypothetical protein
MNGAILEFEKVVIAHLYRILSASYMLLYKFQIGKVHWDKIQIDDKLGDEGRLEFASEKHVYAVLRLEREDNSEKQEREKRTGGGESCLGGGGE